MVGRALFEFMNGKEELWFVDGIKVTRSYVV